MSEIPKLFSSEPIPVHPDDVERLHRMKEKALELWLLYDEVRSNREISVAKTNLEQSLQWAQRGVLDG